VPPRDADLAFLRRASPPKPENDKEVIPVVDLFSGCGGLTLGALEGARRAGRTAELVLAVDNDPAPLAVLGLTFPGSNGHVRQADLGKSLSKSLDSAPTRGERELFGGVPDEPLLVAGPPCQGHSALNNHTRHDDDRNDLYLAVARAAVLLSPRAILVENLRTVERDRRAVVARCAAALEGLGYSIATDWIDLHRIGVPQTRIRHVLVATRGGRFEWDLPKLPGRTIAWAISDLLGAENGNLLDSASRPNEVNRARIEWLFEQDEYNLPARLRPDCHRLKNHSYVSMYGRLRWDEPAQTITSGYGSMGQGRFVHPKRARTLTPHEAARLQFLPDFLRLGEAPNRTALATMIGNAAPPALTIALMRALVAQRLL
jgi:DNA (cytosine-5)-methyltransferase 1